MILSEKMRRQAYDNEKGITLQIPPKAPSFLVLKDVAIFLSALLYASERAVYQRNVDLPDDTVVTLTATAADLDVCVFIKDPFIDACFNRPANPLKMLFRRVKKPEKIPDLQTHALTNLMEKAVSAAFILWFEQTKSEIDKKYGRNDQWPDLFRFIRVVRNAIAHKGQIHISNPKASLVRWHRVEIAPIDSGQPLFPRIDFGDVLLLMLDGAEDLDPVSQGI